MLKEETAVIYCKGKLSVGWKFLEGVYVMFFVYYKKIINAL